jgi:NADH-quinone oxidoreductase subunit E
MADTNNKPFISPPPRNPEPAVPADQLVFTSEEKELIARFRSQYPTPEGAVMKALWLAQEKFGWLPPEVIQLVSDELGMPYAQAFGVATFYTQYYKKKMGTYVLDVCTCFSCQLCGGYDMLHHLEDKLGISKGETTEDGRFTIQEVECLGACGSAPMLQITNGPYVHNLTREKVDALVDALRDDDMPPFISVTLPQDEEELQGNRRSDAIQIDAYVTPPVSQTVR